MALCLRNGVYLDLDRSATEIVQLVQQYGVDGARSRLAERYDLSEEASGRHVRQVLTTLETATTRSSQRARIPSAAGSVRVLRQWLTFSARQRMTTVYLAGLVTVVEVLLRLRPTDQAARWLGAPLVRSDPGELPPAHVSLFTERELTLLGCLPWVQRLWPWDETCLRRALAAGWLLRRHRPALCLGLTSSEGALAHAWLVIEGQALDALPDTVPLLPPEAAKLEGGSVASLEARTTTEPRAGMSTPYRLAGLELACGVVLGRGAATMPLAPTTSVATPRAALESVLLEALQRPPCVIGFSGGRDSSGILALAVHVARAHGLPPPVAATNLFPGDDGSNESEWQEMVIGHLGVADWERLRFSDELDLVGPVAGPALGKWGPCFPFNAHFGLPSFALARHGCYLTGVGGDEIFQLSERNYLGALLTARVRPRRQHLHTAAVALLPVGARSRYYERSLPELPWLRPDARNEYRRRMAEEQARQPIWNAPDLLDYFWRDRGRLALTSTLDAYAASCSAQLVQPYQHPDFLRAIAQARPRVCWLRREDAMRELFGDLLPEALIVRRSKAIFSQPMFSSYSRSFVETWSGQGVDTSLVDPDRLLETWKEPLVDGHSYSLLQAAWCASVTKD